MIRRPPRSTPKPSSAASDVYKRQNICSGYRKKRLVAAVPGTLVSLCRKQACKLILLLAQLELIKRVRAQVWSFLLHTFVAAPTAPAAGPNNCCHCFAQVRQSVRTPCLSCVVRRKPREAQLQRVSPPGLPLQPMPRRRDERCCGNPAPTPYRKWSKATTPPGASC